MNDAVFVDWRLKNEKYETFLYTGGSHGNECIFEQPFGCHVSDGDFRSLSVAEFKEYIADTAVVRLDVRTAEEYAEGHIAGAVNIDVLQPDFEQKGKAVLPKGKTIALYCRSGKRSKKAARILSELHYKVVELDGGYLEWTKAGQ